MGSRSGEYRLKQYLGRLALHLRGILSKAHGEHSINPLYTLSGFCVGVVGMTGVGGGSLMTPLLILLFGIHPATAVGTDLHFVARISSEGEISSRHRLFM